MERLPNYFEYLNSQDKQSGCHPFAYDRDRQAFVVGGKEIGVEVFSPYTFNPDEHGLSWDGLPIDEIKDHSVMIIGGIGRILSGPKMREFVAANPSQIDQADKVMREVFDHLHGDDEQQDLYEDEGGAYDFAARVREGNNLNLQVLGNCSCMYLDPEGDYADPPELGFAEYTFHNDFIDAQTVSLSAGMGHLAVLASK